MNALRLISSGLAAMLLFGCASPGQVKPDVWHRLTTEQQAEATVVEGALAKLVEECRTVHPADQCVPAKVLVTWEGTTPHYSVETHTIFIPAKMLDPLLRAVVAHEIAHSWYPSARDCQGTKVPSCEDEANWLGIAVLQVGYGMPEQNAIRLMWVTLRVAASKPTAPTRAHPDFCAELHRFERRIGAVTPDACQERAAVGTAK
jgi:hypothetical protein